MKLNKYYVWFTAGALTMFFLNNAVALNQTEQAAKKLRAQVEFFEPDSYTDIRPSNESRNRYRERVMQAMETYFTELSELLPEGQTLEVKVTDIDLAGDTRSPRIPVGSVMFDVRVMEDIYFPRIEFSYILKSESGEVLKSADVNLKDMSYLNRAGVTRGSRRGPFPYEQSMLEDWFNETFKS